MRLVLPNTILRLCASIGLPLRSPDGRNVIFGSGRAGRPRTRSGRDPPRTVVFNRSVRRTSKLTYGVPSRSCLVAAVQTGFLRVNIDRVARGDGIPATLGR